MKKPHPGKPLRKGLDEAVVKALSRINKIKEKLIYFYSLSVNYKIPHPPLAMIAKTAFIAVSRTPKNTN